MAILRIFPLLLQIGKPLADDIGNLALILIVFLNRNRLPFESFCKAFQWKRNAQSTARNVDTKISNLLATLHLIDESRLDVSLRIAASLVARRVLELDRLLVIDLNKRAGRQSGAERQHGKHLRLFLPGDLADGNLADEDGGRIVANVNLCQADIHLLHIFGFLLLWLLTRFRSLCNRNVDTKLVPNVSRLLASSRLRSGSRGGCGSLPPLVFTLRHCIGQAERERKRCDEPKGCRLHKPRENH